MHACILISFAKIPPNGIIGELKHSNSNMRHALSARHQRVAFFGDELHIAFNSHSSWWPMLTCMHNSLCYIKKILFRQ